MAAAMAFGMATILQHHCASYSFLFAKVFNTDSGLYRVYLLPTCSFLGHVPVLCGLHDGLVRGRLKLWYNDWFSRRSPASL